MTPTDYSEQHCEVKAERTREVLINNIHVLGKPIVVLDAARVGGCACVRAGVMKRILFRVTDVARTDSAHDRVGLYQRTTSERE